MTIISSTYSSRRPFVLQGVTLRTLAVVVFLSLTFRLFEGFPYLAWTRELWIVTSALSVLLLSCALLAVHQKATAFELYIIFIIAFIPLYVATNARLNFGQPIIVGLLAQRDIALVGCAIMLLHAVRNGFITVFNIKQALLCLAWGTLLLYVAAWMVFDPNDFRPKYFPTFVSGSGDDAVFKFKIEFVVFGALYFFISAIQTLCFKHYVYAGIFISYLVVYTGSRGLIAALVVSLILLSLRYVSIKRLLGVVPSIYVTTVLTIIIIVLFRDSVVGFADKFTDAVSAVVFGGEVDNVSAASRISQFALIKPLLADNWLLGLGTISHNWSGGYQGVLGGRFFPSDLGPIGVLFVYGGIGVVIFLIQYIFAWRYASVVGRARTDIFAESVKAFLLYYFVVSMIQGRIGFFPEVSMIFVAISYLIARGAYQTSGDHST